MTTRPRIFYGWPMVAVGFVCYGLGLGPAYYSWGFFGPELIADLDLSRTEIGLGFGIFTFVYSLAAPLSAFAIQRWGLRATMTFGLAVSALGFFLLSQAQTMTDCLLSFSLIGGVGIGIGCQLPAQTIASYWFRRYRARALALILAGGGIVGILVPYVDTEVLRQADWRFGWQLIAGTSLFVSLVALVFARTKPEDVGSHPDGVADCVAPQDAAAEIADGDVGTAVQDRWTASQALRTPQFFLVTLAAFGSSAPWAAFSAHGRLHLETVGLSLAGVAAVLALNSFVSVWGRFTGAVADAISPPKVLAAALLLEGLGIGGYVFASTPLIGSMCAVVFGLGFGVSLLGVPLVFAHFFGRKAFAGTQGTSRMAVGLVRLASPTLTGYVADVTGSYTLPFLGLMVLALTGSGIAAFCRPPLRRSRS